MDIVDKAQQAEMARILQLLACRLRPVLPLTGKCHNCGEPLHEARFCDTDCRDDHERRFRARLVNGMRARGAQY
ncbi:hypothetical protein ACEV60_15540 [Enterobacter ludwigii]|uniref:hypothetical protein n=1 Tax=Enterobacter TaxID=547 RepID=UPI003BEEC692